MSMVISMKEIFFEELCFQDVDIYDLNAKVQNWREGDVYDYTDSPRLRNGLMYLADCEAEFEWSGGHLTAERGSLIFIPQCMNYHVIMRNASGRENTYLANFRLRNLLPARRIVKVSSNAGELAADFRELAALYISPSAPPLCFKSQMYALLWKSVRLCKSEQKMRFGGIGAALSCMEEDPTGRVSEPKLASLCGMSVPTLIRTMKLYTGMTPKQYSLSLRLRKAKELLIGGIYTVSEISMLLGFSSSSHFCAAFKRCTGVSPGEFAKDRTEHRVRGQ